MIDELIQLLSMLELGNEDGAGYSAIIKSDFSGEIIDNYGNVVFRWDDEEEMLSVVEGTSENCLEEEVLED